MVLMKVPGIYMFRGMRPPECGVAIYTLKYIYTNK